MSFGIPAPQDGAFIAFDTKSNAGYLTGVKVTLSTEVIYMDETVAINLPDHPLYPQLVQFVLANLKRKR